MKQRVYIDISVYGGHFDEEFAEHTIPLFDRLKSGEFTLPFSTVTQDELKNAPEMVRNLLQGIATDNIGFIETTDEAVELATQYIAEK